MEIEPSAYSSFKKQNVCNNCQKLCKTSSETFYSISIQHGVCMFSFLKTSPNILDMNKHLVITCPIFLQILLFCAFLNLLCSGQKNFLESFQPLFVIFFPRTILRQIGYFEKLKLLLNVYREKQKFLGNFRNNILKHCNILEKLPFTR